jgi:DNA-binding SARP family transcriptional activator
VADAIERGLASGVCWLAAPAGYGKTTAIADYLARSALPSLWIRIGVSDGDPAKFFHHLRECLTAGRRAAVPPFPANQWPHVSEFAERFFRAYFEQLPGLVVVVDNLHRVAAPEFETVIEAMLRTLPRSVRCILVARAAPSQRFDDLVADGRLRIVAEDVLKFTPREARLLIVQRLRIAASMIDVSAAQGQAAGLAILARQLAATAAQALEGDDAADVKPRERADRKAEPQLLKIDVLGSFRIELGGRTLDLGAKTPAKSLDILRALAIAPNRSCTLDDLYDWFWPDADGDQAKAACDQALHRIRKLFGDALCVTQRNGRVYLSAANLCVDLDLWETALRAALRPADDKDAAERAMERAFKTFPGPLVQCERATLWLQGAAERVRGKFIELATRLARAYEMRGAHARARSVYLRAIDMYPTCSRCYESLIRSALTQHEYACAFEDFRRYERMLRASGAQPAVAIQTAVKQAMNSQSSAQSIRQSFALA